MSVLNPLPSVSLDDKYRVTGGTVLMNGVQALVRVPVLRRQIDEAQGLNTAGFISGYRGSPLGTYDTQLWAAKHLLTANHIRFQPGVNEDLGATAVWGTQQVNLFPGAKYDGVFGIWYGKSPGVDRSGDVLRHANFAGTSRHGGVLALAGDDHGCKSSSLPSQSEHAFISAEIPILCPADIEELVAFGVKGIALSRCAGLWVGMTTIADVLDSTGTVMIDPALYVTVAPDVKAPVTGLHIALGGTPILREEIHRHFRLPAAQAFARLNGFDRTPIDSAHPRIGIVAAGKSYLDVRQALLDLGIDDERARALGLCLFKPGLTWPLDPNGLRVFANGLEEVIVIEERRDVLEQQIKAIAYDFADGMRPRIVGKCDERGKPLVSDLLELNSAKVARALASRFPAEWKTDEIAARLREIDTRLDETISQPPIHVRTPYFCSGCPHNTSTNLPDNSRAMAGIGCHYLVQWMDRDSEIFTQMGGEGIPWVGAASFTNEKHIFANLGDGTYFHSGSLAIRQAVAAGVNITYKILYNGAVAMTGGQPVDGPLTVPAIVQQMAAEGITRIAIVADDPDRHRNSSLPSWVTIDHRDRLEAIQTELREHPGCSVLIYDQTCATERRRRRKRGLEKPETRRVMINEAVCEGCGDCSTASNCVSIEPVETEFGRKRRVDQSTCNQDFSCLKGFCPSFVTVEGGKPQRAALPAPFDLPDPPPCSLGGSSYNILLAGIGGQGVTSLSAMLGMAAHLDGCEVRVADQLGMAQKGGSVHAHLRIGKRGQPIFGPRVGVGQADLILAADMVVAHGASILPMANVQRTRIVLNSNLVPTGEFVAHNDIRYDQISMKRRLATNSLSIDELTAGDVAVRHFGDTLFGNVILLGYAFQKGMVPLSADAIERAVELNGAAIQDNLAAFRLGRRFAVEPEANAPLLPKPIESFDTIVARRVEELTRYQNAAYATRYAQFVEQIRRAEQTIAPGMEALATTVARGLFKLMAYKDEYEVARLYTNGAFVRQLTDAFGPQTKLRFHMAPPFLGKRDRDSGLPTKSTFGPWMMLALQGMVRMKSLRGTAFDPFSYTVERRQERALIEDYREGILRILDRLTPATLSLAVDYARVAESIRGYGHIKAASVEAAHKRFAAIEAAFEATTKTI